jgi:hypothetical protein
MGQTDERSAQDNGMVAALSFLSERTDSPPLEESRTWVFVYNPYLDVWQCANCSYEPWTMRDTDDPAAGDLSRCPKCHFDGTAATRSRIQIKCCK